MTAMKRTPSKTMEDYREILSEEIDLLRDKKVTPLRVKTITNSVGKFIQSIKVDIEYQKLIGLKEELPYFQYEGKKSA